MINRREFVKGAAVLSAASVLPKFSFGNVKGSGKIKVGLCGCGGRGVGASINMLEAAPNDVEFVAVCDLFQEKLDRAANRIASFAKKQGNKDASAEKIKKFYGWNAIDEMLKEDIDVVIEATPPVFRTPHYEKIVAAGKHAFLEKPACVDVVQAKKMLELADIADKKGLSVVCGTQRRYHEGYQELAKRVQDGMIGDILNIRAVWNDGGYVGHKQHDPKSDVYAFDTMEYQIRNWSGFIWPSGDHIVEQHVHNLDVAMWFLGDTRKCETVRGMGGRSTDLPYPKYGDRFSHFAVDFDMGEGLRIASYCHQDDQTAREIGETFYGTKGIALPSYFGGGCVITDRKGKVLYEAPSPKVQAIVAEHKFLIESIKSGKQVNRLRPLVNSTMLAIAGRESAYSGKKFKYDWFFAKSKGTLYCEEKFGKLPLRGVPVPGKTPVL